MPRPHTPLGKAKLTGAAANHPERFRTRKEPATSGRGVGVPPKHLSATAVQCWKTFADELGWLVHEDRAVMEAASVARATLVDSQRSCVSLPASFFATYRALLGSLGATPVDRTKVHQGSAEEEDDPFAGLEAPKQ